MSDRSGSRGARGGDSPPARQGNGISALEWAVAALGLLLVLGTVGFLLVDAVRGGDGMPRLAVRADSVAAHGPEAFPVSFTARNDGDATAADVTVVGELRDGAGVETVRVLLDFVPGGSERSGVLVLSRDPRGGALRLRVESWREP